MSFNLLPQFFFHPLAIDPCFGRKEIENAEKLTGEGGNRGGVKYNIMRNVVKFNWATELIIYFEEDTHIRKDD